MKLRKRDKMEVEKIYLEERETLHANRIKGHWYYSNEKGTYDLTFFYGPGAEPKTLDDEKIEFIRKNFK